MAQGKEILAGYFREQQLVTLSAGFNVGKSPLMQDWAFCIAAGVPWCGIAVQQRPVIFMSFEAPDWQWYPDFERLAQRYQVPMPHNPQMIETYLSCADIRTPSTDEILKVVAKKNTERINWLVERLASKPNAVVFIDPLEMFFKVKKLDGDMWVALYSAMKQQIFTRYPESAIVMSFNTRKTNELAKNPPDLKDNPHEWLQKASGGMEIQSRSDVRLGLDYKGPAADGIRIFNGARRGNETIIPMVLESHVIGEHPNGTPIYAGFQQAALDETTEDDVLTPRMRAAWDQIDYPFTRDDLESLGLARSTSYQMLNRLRAAKMVVSTGNVGEWRRA